MEEKIYDRQVTKQSLAKRVVDEHQIERHYSQADLNELYSFTPDQLDDPDRVERPLPKVPKVLRVISLTRKPLLYINWVSSGFNAFFCYTI